jgi:hypothetical protein
MVILLCVIVYLMRNCVTVLLSFLPHPHDWHMTGAGIAGAAVPPDPNDPFWCPWNPNTAQPYPRTVTFFIACDPNVYGAVEISAIQNSTEDCE